jgi:hypothetical protein
MSQVKIEIRSIRRGMMQEYFASCVPRAGEEILYEDDQYLVERVIWKHVKTNPTARLVVREI